MKASMAILVIALLFVVTSAIEPIMEPGKTPASFNCDAKCEYRCSEAGRKDRCLEYCGICCAKCQCVPSGTYGHKDECPCYRDWKNSKGGPKCP